MCALGLNHLQGHHGYTSLQLTDMLLLTCKGGRTSVPARCCRPLYLVVVDKCWSFVEPIVYTRTHTHKYLVPTVCCCCCTCLCGCVNSIGGGRRRRRCCTSSVGVSFGSAHCIGVWPTAAQASPRTRTNPLYLLAPATAWPQTVRQNGECAVILVALCTPKVLLKMI